MPDRVREVSFDVGVPGAEAEQRGQQQKRGPRCPCLGTRGRWEGYGNGRDWAGKPAKTSGSRCSKYGAAARIAEAIVPAASWCPYLASPAAISEFSCGQTVPVW